MKTLKLDTCRVGTVLRSVLLVEAVLGVGLLFDGNSGHFMGWFVRLAWTTGGTLPATLLWLLLVCQFQDIKPPLHKYNHHVQMAVGILLGMACGSMAFWMLMWSVAAVGGVESQSSGAVWLGVVCVGGMLAGLQMAWLLWRMQSQIPAQTQARLTELQSRIRPHFLFNTLNTAIALVRRQPQQAETLLEDLSELFRYALVEHKTSVSLAQEITLAKGYMAIEQLRFGHRLKIQWKLPTQEQAFILEQAQLPPLLLQPLLENAVHHGIETQPEGGEIWVHVRMKNNQHRHLVIEIGNTLPQLLKQTTLHPIPNTQQQKGQGMALENVKQRLKLLHDLECTFTAGVQTKTTNQYLVCIELPLPC